MPPQHHPPPALLVLEAVILEAAVLGVVREVVAPVAQHLLPQRQQRRPSPIPTC